MDLLHRMQNRECLTVVMFHRVLPDQERLRLGADLTYTVTPEFLAACVEFLRRNYAIVSLDDVLQSQSGARSLPARPALITFDDGWHDNLEWASPVLQGIPWTVFIATGAIPEPQVWWQEILLRAFRSGLASEDELDQLAERQSTGPGGSAESYPPDLRLLLRYSSLPPERRNRALARFEALMHQGQTLPQMLSATEICKLHRAGVAIGAHGCAHLPLTSMSDPEDDMRRARDWLIRELGGTTAVAMSFPHGRWNRNLATVARGLGYKLLFTSDAVLNRCPGGWLRSDIIGRIAIATHDIADERGHIVPPRMAGWLYRRDRQSIGA